MSTPPGVLATARGQFTLAPGPLMLWVPTVLPSPVMGSPKWEQLRAMSDDELVERYDRQAGHTVVGLNFYIEELGRRETARQTNTIRRLTWAVAFLALVSSVAAVVSTVAVLHG